LNSTNSTLNARVGKYRENNLAFVGNTANYGGDIWTLAINNGFIYVGGQNGPNIATRAGTVLKKYNESKITTLDTLSDDELRERDRTISERAWLYGVPGS
jgi:hypothetical protein